jgi:amino-acid N-acetyltransferase
MAGKRKAVPSIPTPGRSGKAASASRTAARSKKKAPNSDTATGTGTTARSSERSVSAEAVAAVPTSVEAARTTAIVIREATREDIPQLEEFVERFVQANRLLPRTTDELYDLIPFGFVAVSGDRLVGFAALEIYSAKLAEVRSLAVDQDFQGLGIGRGLVQKCVDLAQHRNILEVMAITSSDGFFRACGFDFTLPGEKKALFMQTREKY